MNGKGVSDLVEEVCIREVRAQQAEAARAAAARREREMEADLIRLRGLEREFRREMAQRSQAAKVGAVNTALRAVLMDGLSPRRTQQVSEVERRMAELAEELERSEERARVSEAEAETLRALQAEAMRTFDGGRAGELAASKAHIEFLEQQVQLLSRTNAVAGDEVLRRLEIKASPLSGEVISPRAEEVAAALRERVEHETARREEAEALVGRLLAEKAAGVAPPPSS
eukprot:Hpha_TRINITY_DN8499_c0_g1::TRINITY_DN8499_c0_g1_i1::g.34702::m.34702